MANLKIRGWLNIPKEPLPKLFDGEEFMSFEIKINMYDMIKQDFIKNLQDDGAAFLNKTNIIEEMNYDTRKDFFENYFRERIIDLVERDALSIVQVKLQPTQRPEYWYQVEVALNIEEEYGKYKLRTQFK